MRKAFKLLKEEIGEFEFLDRRVSQDKDYNITVDKHHYVMMVMDCHWF